MLDQALGKLARQHDPNVLVGFDTADDAGVYLLPALLETQPAASGAASSATPLTNSEYALVQTVDFFTPIVDDPFTFGQISATNALSDVYAMGGRPLTALAMVCFPDNKNAEEDADVLAQILAGGLSKMVEAGCTVIGGHSVKDSEIKFGYAVTGLVHPDRVWKNVGARAGDALIFTKAIGTGLVSTAIKRGVAEQTWINAAVVSMTTLNKAATETAIATGVQIHSATDVTGFGLIGHAREMAMGSGVTLCIHASELKLLPGARESVRLGCVPGGLTANRDFAECVVEYRGAFAISDDSLVSVTKLPDVEELRTLLFDPQTAGGLLFSVAQEDSEKLLKALQDKGLPATRIGEVVDKQEKWIIVD